MDEFISGGISRRNLIKLLGAGAVSALLPHNGQAAPLPTFEPGKGKGLIFVVGDGMPLGVIRAMHEIRTGVFGRKDSHLYARLRDSRSSVGYMSTASLTSIVTDSAPASVAWATGVKTANRFLASLPNGQTLTTIMELLKGKGIGCGLVTTTRVTHATPAAWVSHQPHRDLEDNIALDLLAFAPDVLLGGGSVHFDPAKRSDKRDLFAAFSAAGYEVVKERKSLLARTISRKPLIGIFARSHLAYAVDRLNDPSLSDQPSLPEMTRIALEQLSAHPRGFILQVEAGRIDHASHSNDAWGAIMDTLELDDTLAVIDSYLAANPETLVIFTSDHGNSGWGINGTGADYNDATTALRSYRAATASFEVIIKKLKGKQPAEIVEIVREYTGFAISPAEARMIVDAMAPGYATYPGDFIYQPDATLAKILCHSAPAGSAGTPAVRRGNVGFTSCNHTAEDQLLLAYGHRAREFGMDRLVDNTYLFEVMCRYFGISHRNPTMTAREALPLIPPVSTAEWRSHMKRHIA